MIWTHQNFLFAIPCLDRFGRCYCGEGKIIKNGRSLTSIGSLATGSIEFIIKSVVTKIRKIYCMSLCQTFHSVPITITTETQVREYTVNLLFLKFCREVEDLIALSKVSQ